MQAASQVGDHRTEVLCSALSLVCLGMIGDVSTAQQVAKTVMVQINAVDELTAAQALVNLAVYFLQSGELVEAARLFSQQAEITGKLGNLRFNASALTNLGYTYVLLGFFSQGCQSLDQSLQVHRSIGERKMEGYDLLNRGLALWRMNNYTQAFQDLELAGSLLKETDDPYGLAARQVYLGQVDESTGDYTQARKHFAEALVNFEQLAMRGPAVDARAGLARNALVEGDLDIARQQAVEIEATLHENGPLGMEFPIRAYLTCARVWQATGERERLLCIIEEGYVELASRAEKISMPEWRQSYLEKIPEHSELVALWKEYQPVVGNSPAV
jgi:tetratricopeptide (TPR) repeat protein